MVANSNINFEINNGAIYENAKNEIWLKLKKNDSVSIFKFNKQTQAFSLTKTYFKLQLPRIIKDENNFYTTNDENKIIRIKDGKVIKESYGLNTATDSRIIFYIYSKNSNTALQKYAAAKYYTTLIDSNLNISNEIPFLCDEEISGTFKNNTHHFNYGFTGNKPLLINNYLKKYPTLFDGNNASNVFTLREDNAGRIWAGSYKNNIAIIDKGKIAIRKNTDSKISNGGSFFNNYMYLVGEGKGGLLQYDMKGNPKKVNTSSTGFFTYISKTKKNFYYTTINNLGLWQTTTQSLETLKPLWNKIDSSKGNTINNILTITEDTLGRIWCGHPRNGISIYNPTTDKASSWILDKKETPFGAMSSITDSKGAVWIGGRNGLWYYNDYSKAASPQNCIKLHHPLIDNAKNITSLALYEHWLLIAAYDKILLLDLERFYENKQTIVRYLNPYEANFTSFTEQNTMLTAKDSTVWFSTGDMLYNWDIKNWLVLEAPKVKTTIIALGNKVSDTLLENKTIEFNPNFNSFDITLHYVSPDNMLRYTRTALLKNGDTIIMEEPSLINNFAFKNLRSGHYIFYIDIFEIDGSTSHYEYKIIIKKFLWQQWWFWLAIALLCIAIVAYLLNLKKKKQLAEQAAKTKEAELQTVKAEQAKRIANLQLVTLSSQFRPHFILNALNTIGAQMDDKPEAESVLSRLGESINLIFSHAQQQKIVHPFSNEWQLVENIIHIHRLMYLKQLQTDVPTNDVLKKYSDIKVPLGILQIPIENALLHGLSNKEHEPWLLAIKIQENNDYIFIEINDNGVGRKKSATLSNFTKHGTGTKNLMEIISIINASNPHKIMVEYKDDAFTENNIGVGTTVIITLPKLLDYANE